MSQRMSLATWRFCVLVRDRLDQCEILTQSLLRDAEGKQDGVALVLRDALLLLDELRGGLRDYAKTYPILIEIGVEPDQAPDDVGDRSDLYDYTGREHSGLIEYEHRMGRLGDARSDDN